MEREYRLTPRKQDILRAVIRDYILTAEPVGSRTLSKKYDLGLSPATIRNELSDLEDEGLLRQPHTSAGRIPSDHGYRLFVDTLMEREAMAREKRAELERWPLRGEDLSDLMQQAAKLTALLSGCTAMVRPPKRANSRVKFIQLTPVAEMDILMVLLTDQGQVTNQVVRLPSPMAHEELVLIANFLNEQLRDKPLDQLTETTLKEVNGQLAAYQDFLTSLMARVQPAVENERLYVSHQSYLAQQPEFSDVGKVSQLLSLLEREPMMIRVMDAIAPDGAEVRVAIGSENPVPDLQECSLVTATYRLGDRVLGELAVIGPTRMHYSQAIAAVELMADRLTAALTELYGLESSPLGGHLGRRRTQGG